MKKRFRKEAKKWKSMKSWILFINNITLNLIRSVFKLIVNDDLSNQFRAWFNLQPFNDPTTAFGSLLMILLPKYCCLFSEYNLF